MAKVGQPQINPKSGVGFELAGYLNKHLDDSGMSNEAIGEELGYSRGNIVSMWRTGRTRVPLNRLQGLARLMSTGLETLLPLWLEQYLDANEDGYEEIMSCARRIATSDEAALLGKLRNITGGKSFAVKRGAEKSLAEAITIRE